MSLNYLMLTFLIISFCFVLNEDIQIKNFEEIIIPKGENFTCTYQYTKPIVSDLGIYFYFKFSNSDNSELIIKPENGTQSKITIYYKGYWYNYYVSTESDIKYYFEIINKQSYDISMIFIDSSQEINLDLEIFINLNFNTEKIYDNPPNPLIFNIDVTQNDTLYYFIANKGDFIDSDSLLYYCIKDEVNECTFTELKSLNFEKDKKYKVKLNGYQYEGNNIYYKFEFFGLIKEVQLGFISYNSLGNENVRYFIMKFDRSKTFYLYGDSSFEYDCISETKKK